MTMTIDEQLALCKHALETIRLLLEHPSPQRAGRCRVLADSALKQIGPVDQEITVKPHINQENVR